jgi:hypothetical protein
MLCERNGAHAWQAHAKRDQHRHAPPRHPAATAAALQVALPLQASLLFTFPRPGRTSTKRQPWRRAKSAPSCHDTARAADWSHLLPTTIVTGMRSAWGACCCSSGIQLVSKLCSVSGLVTSYTAGRAAEAMRAGGSVIRRSLVRARKGGKRSRVPVANTTSAAGSRARAPSRRCLCPCPGCVSVHSP